MPRYPWARCVLLLAGAICAGCADNPLVLQGQVQGLSQQQLALTRQNQQIQERATALDRDNQELQASLAQAKQRTQAVDEQLKAVREQLATVTTQLAQARDEKRATDNKVQALTASMHRQGGVTITPNNSLQQALPAINIPQVQVRRDGDVVRIELPCNRLFDRGAARLRPGATELIATVAGEIMRTYPEQVVGVEGHTEGDQIVGGFYRTNHELSVAQAMAVYDTLVNQLRFPAGQLVVAGHGPNHPVVSNATEMGKDRNRRVELVIYPDKAAR